MKSLVFCILIFSFSTQSAFALERILLVGDSITQGQFSGPEGKSWADLLAEHFEGRFEIINAGLAGSSSHDWTLNRPSLWPEPYNEDGSIFNLRARPYLPAKIVILMLGTNDSVGFMKPRPISSLDYSLNTSKILSQLVHGGAEKVIVMLPPKRFYDDEDVEYRLHRYRMSLRAYSIGIDAVILGPDFSEILTKKHFEGIDVHPNIRGYKKMAGVIIDFVETELQK